ncbi:MAG: transposase [Candidatus Kapabacteria bacterium]|nr:transposase [Candidatus Kapabacteria bacterium]
MGNTTNHGRRYDDEFKQQAVLLVVRDGLAIRRVASDLGVSEQTLVRWVDDNRRSTSPAGALAKDDELRRLRKEMELVKTERDILKNASVSSRNSRNDVCLHPRASTGMETIGDGARVGSHSAGIPQVGGAPTVKA